MSLSLVKPSLLTDLNSINLVLISFLMKVTSLTLLTDLNQPLFKAMLLTLIKLFNISALNNSSFEITLVGRTP
ncbi:hypothetical protein BGX38DRAFT_1205092 [Terfezia claveryi]|nr:hypothetical protein BGX38DRAFT_1205092 [Terfezia claveryi]